MISQKLEARVLGQSHVFKPIEKYVKMGERGWSRSNQPKGAFLFTGPTGTGKTETAKALSDILNCSLLRFDMSEYQDDKKFLTDLCFRLESCSHGIILLDEIEKGNMKIFDYFLQILSEGMITFERKPYYLTSFYIIMTSNIGSKNIMGQDDFAVAEKIVEQLVKSYFRAEFLGRIVRNCQICFRPLDYDTMKQIIIQKVKFKIAPLQEKGCKLTFSEDILSFLMHKGVNPEFGARPIDQAVHEHISLAMLNAEDHLRSTYNKAKINIQEVLGAITKEAVIFADGQELKLKFNPQDNISGVIENLYFSN